MQESHSVTKFWDHPLDKKTVREKVGSVEHLPPRLARKKIRSKQNRRAKRARDEGDSSQPVPGKKRRPSNLVADSIQTLADYRTTSLSSSAQQGAKSRPVPSRAAEAAKLNGPFISKEAELLIKGLPDACIGLGEEGRKEKAAEVIRSLRATGFTLVNWDGM